MNDDEYLTVEITFRVRGPTGQVRQTSMVRMDHVELETKGDSGKLEPYAFTKNVRFVGERTFKITGTVPE